MSFWPLVNIEDDAEDQEVGQNGRSTIGDQGQGDSGDGNQSDNHAHILELLIEQHGDGSDDDQSVSSSGAVVSHLAQIQIQQQADQNDEQGSDQSEALAKGSEDEVSVRFRDRNDIGLQTKTGQTGTAQGKQGSV